MDILMNYITNLIDLLLLHVFFVYLFKEKPVVKNGIIIIFLVAFLNTIINNYLGLGSLWGFSIMFLVLGIMYTYIYKKRIAFMYLSLLLGIILMFVIEIIIASFFFIIKVSPNNLYELNTYRIIGVVSSKAVFLVLSITIISKLNVVKYEKDKIVIPITSVLTFNVIIIYMTFILYKYIGAMTILDYVNVFGMGIGAVFFTWMVFMLMKRLMQQNEKEVLWKMREKEYRNQRMYFSNLQEILTTLKAQRHDFNNHMSTVYGMIQLNKNDDAKKYILRLVDSVTELNDILQANHPVISSLINIKYQIAKKENINMRLNLSMPEELSLDYIDLSIVIGNLLDNAIEACRNVEAVEKNIDVEINQRNEFIVFNIINSKNSNLYVKEDLAARYTTKTDEENHGFGLSNVKQVVDKYKGMINIEDLTDKFKVNIALPNKIDVK